MSRTADDASTIGVLMVGYDGAGTQNHQFDMYEPALLQHPDFRIRAVSDHPGVTSERRELSRTAAERLDVPYLEDLDEALARADITLASVCVAFADRVDTVRRAASQGVHVLMDKPMALTLEDVDAMDEVARSAGVHCIPANHIRHLSSVERLGAALREGTVGDLVSVHADFIVTTGATRDAQGDPRPWPLGELMNFLTYPVDAIRSITGREFERVHATRGGFFYGGDDDEDLGTVALTLAGQVHVTLVVCRAPLTGHLTAGAHRYRVVGTEGVLLLDARRPHGLLHSVEPSRRVGIGVGGDSLPRMLDDVSAALSAGLAPTLTPADARAALEVTLAARRSADTGREVRLPVS
jgi:predicted dehydrogenase